MRNCFSSSMSWMTSRMETIPTTLPPSSTRRCRVKWSRIVFAHSPSLDRVEMLGRSVRIASPMGIEPESPRASTRPTRSRSVTRPMIRPPSRTATEPTLRSAISRAASRQGVMESSAITSRVTCLSMLAMVPPSRRRIGRRCAFHAPGHHCMSCCKDAFVRGVKAGRACVRSWTAYAGGRKYGEQNVEVRAEPWHVQRRGGGMDSIAENVVFQVVGLAVVVFELAALWKVFKKAGEPGWASIVPLYNLWVLLRISGKPGWWIILMLIPLVNIVVGILEAVALARAFGKGGGFAAGLILLPVIFYPVLAWGDAQYQGGGAPVDALAA